MVRKGLAVYLCVWMLLLGILVPLQGFAMLAPSGVAPAADQVSETQASLEVKVVSQRLAEIGLTQDEIQARMADLTPDQLHQVAQNLDGLQVGGDVLIILAVVAAVIVVLALITGVTHGAEHAAHDTSHAVGHH
jgi:hypothetical protein